MDVSGLTMFQACLLQARAERTLHALMQRHLQEWNLTKMQWLVLAAANEQSRQDEGHAMSELARVLDIRLSQLTPLICDLNERGLLSIAISSGDKRTKYVTVTTKGRKIITETENALRAVMRQWLADVPINKISSYMDVVQIIGNPKSA